MVGTFTALDGRSGAGVNLAARLPVSRQPGHHHRGNSSGPNGAAGAAVVSYGDFNVIHNAGSLVGGTQADGSRALAVIINGDVTELNLTTGSGITGDLLSTGADTRLTLFGAGTTNSNFTGFSSISAFSGPLTAQKKINLVNTVGATLNFWNANGLARGSQAGGGIGTWSTTSANWTDSAGSFTAPMQPQPGFAVFGGAPGTVTVDNSSGAVAASGIQFASDGYVLQGAP